VESGRVESLNFYIGGGGFVMSDAIQEDVRFLIKNCKLAPKPDAVLHMLISDLMFGAELLTANPGAPEGMAQIVRALGHYAEYFNDPGWTPLP